MVNQIFIVDLDPTKGAEMKKVRPCVVISPDEMNDNLRTVIVAPITSVPRHIPTRVFVAASTQNGLNSDSYIALDQIKTIDKTRLSTSPIGTLSRTEAALVSNVLCQMFAIS